MGRADYFAHGDYNVICDRCGTKYKASDCVLEWDNLFVCQECHEPRHPQEFLRGIPDRQSVEIPRPDTTPTFITNPITPEDL